mmetsp:Transcript_35617/g.90085  ORF Transcript_35617/g.90085 Transcript_35617/m.90085 type:complete len:264 (+) Transcript_35617:235-1026(+)
MHKQGLERSAQQAAVTSMDFSMSPSFSVSAFLQSIMPAPVLLRSSLTTVAEMSAEVHKQPQGAGAGDQPCLRIAPACTRGQHSGLRAPTAAATLIHTQQQSHHTLPHQPPTPGPANQPLAPLPATTPPSTTAGIPQLRLAACVVAGRAQMPLLRLRAAADTTTAARCACVGAYALVTAAAMTTGRRAARTGSSASSSSASHRSWTNAATRASRDWMRSASIRSMSLAVAPSRSTISGSPASVHCIFRPSCLSADLGTRMPSVQ